MQQTLDHVNHGISPYTQVGGGLFTNISRYTREGDRLIENTRLTVTRKYPLGYKYFKTNEGDVLIWADGNREDQSKAQLLLTGEGEAWISHAKKVYKTDYSEVLSSTLLTFGGTVFFGTLFLVLHVGQYTEWILGFFFLAFAYYRWFPNDPSKKSKHLFVALMLFAIGLKIYVTVISNPDIEFYAHIYPMFLGNKPVLMTTMLITSGISYLMMRLWNRQYPYIESLTARFGIFIGFEAFFYIFTIGVYLLSSMMKNNFMV